MSQYKKNTVDVVNGSPVVTGNSTLFLSNVNPGDAFTVAGTNVIYDVASVDSDTQISLSAPYGGTTATGVTYAITRDFTSPDNFPELVVGDIETPTILTRSIRKIQQRFNQASDYTDQSIVDHEALPDPHPQYLSGSANLSDVAAPATSFTNIKQNATTTSTGVIEKATTAESEAGTADKYPDAAGVHAAFKQYGLGSIYNSVSDANNALISGFYCGTGSLAINFPASTRYGELLVLRRDNRIQQIAFIGTENYLRDTSDTGATWSPWRLIYNQANILGTVSQSAGVPTGAIIERGSNANGEYTKFADGTMICQFFQAAATSIAANTTVLYWTFPVGFISSNYFAYGAAKPITTDDFFGFSHLGIGTTSGVPLAVKNGATAQDVVDIRYCAIGRWY